MEFRNLIDRIKHNTFIIYIIVFSHLAGIFGCVVAIFLLCNDYPNIRSDIDYLGVIIGILAILVTLLVAWNIYSAIGTEKRVNNALSLQNEQEQKIEKKFEGLQSYVNAQIESIQNQFAQILERAESDKEAYIMQFNALQGQVSIMNNDKDYLQQYAHFQTALNALLKCTHFPSDIRHNIETLLDMMDYILKKIPEESEISDVYYNLYDEDREEFITNMEEISKSPRKEFSFVHRQKFIGIASMAKELFYKKYNSTGA